LGLRGRGGRGEEPGKGNRHDHGTEKVPVEKSGKHASNLRKGALSPTPLNPCGSCAAASGHYWGKLCRNPFSTLNLLHEHGRRKALWPSTEGIDSDRRNSVAVSGV